MNRKPETNPTALVLEFDRQLSRKRPSIAAKDGSESQGASKMTDPSGLGPAIPVPTTGVDARVALATSLAGGCVQLEGRKLTEGAAAMGASENGRDDLSIRRLSQSRMRRSR